MKRLRAALLTIPMILPAWATAQQPAAVPPVSIPGQVNSLKILVLEGQDAVNSTAKQKGTPPVIEVRDTNDRPVEGATVVFRLPLSGPGGFFLGQTGSFTTRTNGEGQALASGFAPNTLTGRFNIHVTAISGSRIGEIDIPQTNSVNGGDLAEKRHFKMTKWKWVGVGAAVAAVTVVIVLVTRGGSSTPTVTISPGPVTIGGS